MSKKTLAVSLGIFLVIAASLVYVWVVKEKETPLPSAPQTQVEPEAEEKVQAPAPEPIKGSYTDYSADLLASAKGTKLLFFYAPWCPQCRALDESIKNSELPDGTTIFKVDYDSNQTLRAKYGVTLQTTVVKIGDDGSKLASYIAYDEPTFQSVKRALLP